MNCVCLRNNQQRYDVVILDPPPLPGVKGRTPCVGWVQRCQSARPSSLPSGGVLVSCSCSQPVSDDDFWNMLQSARAMRIDRFVYWNNGDKGRTIRCSRVCRRHDT